MYFSLFQTLIFFPPIHLCMFGKSVTTVNLVSFIPVIIIVQLLCFKSMQWAKPKNLYISQACFYGNGIWKMGLYLRQVCSSKSILAVWVEYSSLFKIFYRKAKNHSHAASVIRVHEYQEYQNITMLYFDDCNQPGWCALAAVFLQSRSTSEHFVCQILWRAATNDYFNHRLICWFFSWLINLEIVKKKKLWKMLITFFSEPSNCLFSPTI